MLILNSVSFHCFLAHVELERDRAFCCLESSSVAMQRKKGAPVAISRFAISLYADDTTAFIRDDLSAASLVDLLDQFEDLSGLKINKSKTEGLWLGVWKCRLGKDEPFGISWPKQYVTALGIAFPYNVRAGNKNKL